MKVVELTIDEYFSLIDRALGVMHSQGELDAKDMDDWNLAEVLPEISASPKRPASWKQITRRKGSGKKGCAPGMLAACPRYTGGMFNN